MKRLVSALALAISIPATAETFVCSGTEPFWSATFTQNIFEFRSPANPLRSYPIRARITPLGFPQSFATVIHAEGAKTPLVAYLRKIACSDGMSDKAYTHELLILEDGVAYSGCCVRK